MATNAYELMQQFFAECPETFAQLRSEYPRPVYLDDPLAWHKANLKEKDYLEAKQTILRYMSRALADKGTMDLSLDEWCRKYQQELHNRSVENLRENARDLRSWHHRDDVRDVSISADYYLRTGVPEKPIEVRVRTIDADGNAQYQTIRAFIDKTKLYAATVLATDPHERFWAGHLLKKFFPEQEELSK